MSTLIKSGTIVTASDTFIADIRIEGEKITLIGKNLPQAAGDTVINASGKYIFPGGIDVHTHFELPFMGTVSADNFSTGTTAAINGGTTTIIDFVIPTKGKPLKEALQAWHGKAEGKAVTDYGFHMCINEYTDAVEREIPSIIGQGVSSFKCFMAYKGVLQIDDGQIVNVLKTVGQNGGMVSVHAENGDMIASLMKDFLATGKTEPEYHWRAHPSIAEEEAVARIISLAEFAGQSIYIVHLSGKDGLEKVKAARAKGLPVFAETCPQYLLLPAELYLKPNFEGAKYVMSPPLRPADHLEKMWEGLAKGYIQTVATDHCPFNFKGQKEMGKDDFSKIPNGIPAIGDRFNLLYTYGVTKGRISLNRFVEVVATNPAKIFGMYPQKGSITVGGDADVVIFDPKSKTKITAATQKHNVDYSAFEGFELEGQPTDVLLRGKFAVRNGTYVGEQGLGKFISRKVSGKML
jgi:dihydropyrimidinase